jgi:hypothetical protein
MIRRADTLLCSLVFTAALTLMPSPARAQSHYLPRDGKYAVLFEMLHPTFEGVTSSALSAAYFLSGRVMATPRLALVGELPYANHESSSDGYYYYFGGSSSTFGDPYLGMEAQVASGPVFLEFGIRPALASDVQGAAELTGVVSDATRWNAFDPGFWSIQVAFDVQEITPSKIGYLLRLSPVVQIPTESGYGGGELHAVYSFLIGYHGSSARVTAGSSGRMLLTGGYGNLGTRAVTQLEVHADFLSGSIRPGLGLTLPLGSVANGVPVVLGFNIAWSR